MVNPDCDPPIFFVILNLLTSRRRKKRMRIRKPGKVQEGVWFLGRKESGVYLLEGKNGSMIISGGMSYIIPDILEQIKGFGIDEKKINKILILHSHFDHVGIIPFFKRRNPQIEVYASARAWELLKMEKAIVTINEFSRNVAKRMNREKTYSEYDLEWRDDIFGRIVREGEKIELGGLTVSIFETPGHSSCCIAAYISKLKTLFPTDGGGIPFDETIITSGNSNFTKYQESLERLKPLDVEYYCADHYGYVTGEEARQFIPMTIDMAKKKRAQMEEAYRSTRNIDAAAKLLISSFYEESPDYFLSPDIFFDVHRQMIRHIATVIDQK
jgi:glyoxylase-like metal-dependent hydrolase (beta-lactamase superfamily II)